MTEYTDSHNGNASIFWQGSDSFQRGAEEGFTLVELTIVLVIVALLIGGMLLPLSAQRDLQSTSETQKQLSEIKEALLGFAAANGRLPCPAAPNTTGAESPSSNSGICTNPWDGFLPAITLGIQPADSQGYAIDSWGNRIRYAVTTGNSNAFTKPNGIRELWGTTTFDPDLVVCNSASAITDPNTGSASCPAANVLTTGAAAIVLSHGKNGAVVPTNADELANWPIPTAKDNVFVAAQSGPDFDDLIVWLSPNILYNRMISAGKLP